MRVCKRDREREKERERCERDGKSNKHHSYQHKRKCNVFLSLSNKLTNSYNINNPHKC